MYPLANAIEIAIMISIFIYITKGQKTQISYTPDQLLSFRWNTYTNKSFENMKIQNSILKKIAKPTSSKMDKRSGKNKRGGNMKIKILFANTHGLDSFMRASNITNLLKSSVCFLSETWLTKDKYKNWFENKFCMVAHAKKHPKGRPFGGLQLLANPNMNPRPFSQGDNHLALEVRGLSIIRFYFTPSSDLDR